MMPMARLIALLFAVLCCGAPPLLAQVPDPTRPTAQITAPEPGGSVAAGPAGSGIQAVIVRRGGKSGAVINGEYVEVDSKLGDKRVVRITESEVVLKGAGEREVIKLIPSVEKKPVVTSTAKSAIKRRSTGKTEQ